MSVYNFSKKKLRDAVWKGRIWFFHESLNGKEEELKKIVWPGVNNLTPCKRKVREAAVGESRARSQ